VSPETKQQVIEVLTQAYVANGMPADVAAKVAQDVADQAEAREAGDGQDTGS
jgi:hypothetical protein